MFDRLVVGAGFAGSVIAERPASHHITSRSELDITEPSSLEAKVSSSSALPGTREKLQERCSQLKLDAQSPRRAGALAYSDVLPMRE